MPWARSWKGVRVSIGAILVVNGAIQIGGLRSFWCSRWGLGIVFCSYLVRIVLAAEL